MPMKKFWNIPASPVFALLTQDPDHLWNYNCCTYVVPVGLTPKHYLTAVYRGSKTLQNLLLNPHQKAVLHLLAPEQARLIRILGQRSGHDLSKFKRLHERGEISEWKGYPVLRRSAAWALMNSEGPLSPDLNPPSTSEPDHRLWLWRLETTRIQSEEYLHNHHLKALGIIR